MKLNLSFALVAAIAALSAQNASAESCSFDAIAGSGDVVNSFTEEAVDNQEACRIAERECQGGLIDLQRDGHANLACVATPVVIDTLDWSGRRDRDRDRDWRDRDRDRRNSSCQARMVNRRGELIHSYLGYSRSRSSACSSAVRQCQRELYRYHARGRHKNASCHVSGRRWNVETE